LTDPTALRIRLAGICLQKRVQIIWKGFLV